MKTLEQIKKTYESQTIDGRDISRLMRFIPEEDLVYFGIQILDEYKGKHQPVEYTRENILKELESDVAFGFEKALNMRGLSAGAMFNVVKMWNWILEEGLEDWDDNDYAQYGLPLFKATAVKYGFDNPIGDDYGDESTYSEESLYDYE